MSRRLPLRKRILFSAIVFAMMACVTEIFSLVAYRLSNAHWYTWSMATVERRNSLARCSTLDRSAEPHDYNRQAVHPYLGYVEEPGWRGPRRKMYRFLWEETNVNHSSDGFLSRQSVVQRRKQGTKIIGICGGSVAHFYYRQGIHSTLNELREHPDFRRSRFVVVCLALGGYKQPQQLMALNYVLAQGGELDLLINIDGFNEVALHSAENAKKNVYPLFPHSWYFRMGQVRDPLLLRLIGQSALLEEKIQTSVSLYGSRPLRLSPTCHLVWRARQRRLEHKHAALLRQMAIREENGGFDVTGPLFRPGSEREMYEHLVAIWQRCSHQLHALCKANDIQYFHFLQPNQYLEGSKRLSEEERILAFREDHPYRNGVVYGYPLLQQAGAELRSHGIKFSDLTQIFSEISEQIYTDDCCHFGPRGNEIMAHEITRAIIAELNRE